MMACRPSSGLGRRSNGKCRIKCQVSVHWRESSQEKASLALLVLLVAGVVWACLPAFKEWRMRILLRSALVVIFFVSIYATTYFYSWHVRPNVGLYEESDWVTANPAFRKVMRERIERNKWWAPNHAMKSMGESSGGPVSEE